MKSLLFLAIALTTLFSCAQPGPVVRDYSFEVDKTDEEWKAELTPKQFDVLCGGATEAPFTGEYLYNKAEGVYKCAACESPLFTSDTKFDSGSGWPSFYNQIAPEAITEIPDSSHGMVRTEIVCAKCGGHLGHLFNDGPYPSGMRYCVNSVSLQFEKVDSLQEEE